MIINEKNYTHHLYLIEINNLYKVGITGNLEKRLYRHQNKYHRSELILIHSMKYPAKSRAILIEKMLKIIWRDYQYENKTEWFHNILPREEFMKTLYIIDKELDLYLTKYNITNEDIFIPNVRGYYRFKEVYTYLMKKLDLVVPFHVNVKRYIYGKEYVDYEGLRKEFNTVAHSKSIT